MLNVLVDSGTIDRASDDEGDIVSIDVPTPEVLLVTPPTVDVDMLSATMVEDGKNTPAVVVSAPMLLVCVVTTSVVLGGSEVDDGEKIAEDVCTSVVVKTTVLLSLDNVKVIEAVVLDSTGREVCRDDVGTRSSELIKTLELDTEVG